MSQFLTRALRLRERGYTVVAVRPGQKGPRMDGWQNIEPDEKDLKRWSQREYKNGNIGINTRNNPAVDLDIYDADMAAEMENWICAQYPNHELCVRVGRAPKRLIVFRADEPFRKLQATYTDGTTEHKVEILGAGQQFVAYGIHPDTRLPYEWTSMDEPLNMDSADLPVLTLESAQDVIDKFCLLAEERGWVKVTKNMGVAAVGGGDDLETFKPIMAITREKVMDTLDMLPNTDLPFDSWLEVGMALHHQFEGDQDGLELWHEWSAQSGKCEPSEVNRRWESFGNGPATVTFATLLKKAKQARDEAADLMFEKTLNKASTCNNKKVLIEELVPRLASCFTTELQFETAVAAVQTRIKHLEEGVTIRKETARRMIRAHVPKAEREKDVPRWCNHWVFVQVSNEFYNTVTGMRLTAGAFDNTYGRELISEAHRDKGESFAGKASQVALNLYRLPLVYDYLYYPGADEFMELGGLKMVNTYNNHLVPSSAMTVSKADRDAIEVIENHFKLLIKNDYERNMLLDFLAYNVQYPSERVHWAPVLQGVDGGGKSFIKALMASVMGTLNVGTATSGDLHEQYTKWAEGRKMVFFEEVKVKGVDKFEIVNKIKEYITNPSVKIRRMQRDSYEIPNMTNYFIFTNYIDAIPYDKNDRRYFVLRTTFLTNSHIAKFMKEHPNYFNELFAVLGTHYPAIRWWFENRALSDDFNPKGHAPRTDAWEVMYAAANYVDEDEENEVDRVIRENNGENPLLTNEVLSLDALRDASENLTGVAPQKLSTMLQKLGFAVVGRFRLGGRDSTNERIYTRRSEVFSEIPGEAPIDTVRRLMRKGEDDGFGD